jgi:uncharacterized protein YutE (UPF0331/DUF86 family)
MLNHTLIESLLTEIDANVNLLDELKTLSEDEFVKDPHHYLLAERCFQLAIQCVLDICYYIAAKNGWDKPEDGAAAILLMGEKGVLTNELARKIVGMANFRNILAHAYLNINREIVFSNLREVVDFRTFSAQVLKYLSD